MGVSADAVPDESNVDDSQSEVVGDRAVTLYKVSDASGNLAVSEVSGMPLAQEMLNPEVIVQLITAQKLQFIAKWLSLHIKELLLL